MGRYKAWEHAPAMVQKKGAGARWGAHAGGGNFGEKNDPPARRQAWVAPLKSLGGNR